ncbi:hypothetical protein OG946_23875 [Streptomyces sp. NBC_01808]|uniref:hypothetical protein n=1 Tax=Streptomyces sp. NBC_01808 TaxID=2975947 RepID=UPI002DD88C23|nr:hypothetical protein [Streptomyces sp. NBC_01808]WSA40136.1 hypothetical protein OG946_23875 [Streptomyces sp. NBC_01808]
MNAILDYTVGTLVLLLMAAILAGPALYFDRRERLTDRRLKAAERGDPAPAGDVSVRDALARYGRAA